MRVMYVCLCHAVKDSEILRAVDSGALDIGKLAEQLGVGTGCGMCREFAQALIDERVEESRPLGRRQRLMGSSRR